jgi:hypothetical protein
MPAGKRQQSNTVLYTLILFVGLFIVACVLAVVFYTKAEENRSNVTELERTIADLASTSEQNRLSSLVGAKSGSYLGTLLGYHDGATAMVLGMPVEATSSEVKFDQTRKKTQEAVQIAQTHIKLETVDPNTGLVPIISKLDAVLNNLKSSNENLQKQLTELQTRMDGTVAAALDKERTLAAEKDEFHQASMKVAQDYEQTKALMEQTADERVETIKTRLDQERANAKKLNQNLLRTEAQLDQTQGRMADALDKVKAIEPDPNREIEAYRPDGKLILVNGYTDIVHINLGAKDRVYRGLTFSIFDKGSLIAKNGTAKAEVEVYELADDYCLARVVKSNPKNPVALDDIATNLIWDAKKPKSFILTGDFDLDKNGTVDMDAADRITSLMEKWGGTVSADVSVDTDAVVIGRKPKVPPKPTLEDLELDPLAGDRFNAAQTKLARYQAVEKRAVDLMIPIYKYDQFLYLIGYTSQINKPGAF